MLERSKVMHSLVALENSIIKTNVCKPNRSNLRTYLFKSCVFPGCLQPLAREQYLEDVLIGQIYGVDYLRQSLLATIVFSVSNSRFQKVDLKHVKLTDMLRQQNIHIR